MSASKTTKGRSQGSKILAKKDLRNGALSQEFVDSSDGSSHEVQEQPNSTQSKAKTDIAVHRPKANGITKAHPTSSKTSKIITKPFAKASSPTRKIAAKQVVAGEQPAESTESSNEGEYEDTDMNKAYKRQEEPAQGSTMEDSSSSDSLSDISDEEDAPPTKSAVVAATVPKPQSQPQTVAFQPARPYVPPKGFVEAPTQRAAVSSNTTLFEHLQGKQIWHITAPEGVSIKDLKELAMEQAVKGATLFERGGIKYGFSKTEENSGNARKVIVPQRIGCKAVRTPITQTFHIREVLGLPELGKKQNDKSTTNVARSITASSVRAPRVQVKGLKMRYYPSGIIDHTPTTLGSPDSEGDVPERLSVKAPLPNGLHLPPRLEKRKHKVNKRDAEHESPTKKHKHHGTLEERTRKEEKKAKREKRSDK